MAHLRNWLLASLFGAVTAGIAAAQSNESGARPDTRDIPEPITTRQALFSIPFFVNPRTASRVEVQLFVSADQGQTWTLYQRRPGTARRFDFQAGQDGEFWFVVRTNEQASQPTSDTSPEKVVIVDTATPRLELTVDQGPTGQIVARWRAEDDHLDASTFRLQYQTNDDVTWQPVTIVVTDGTMVQGTFQGDVSWVAPVTHGDITVRAEILDRAGNLAATNQRRTLHRVAASPTQLVNTSDPSSQAETSIEHRMSDDESAVAGDPAPTSNSELQPLVGLPEEPPLGDGWLSDWSNDLRSEPQPSAFQSAKTDAPRMASVDRPTQTDPAAAAFDESATPADDRYPSWSDRVSLEDSIDAGKQGNEPAAWDTPNGRTTQSTNSRRFHLDYDLDDVGSAGAARVELWITSDGGKSWSAFGTDEDRRSPFLVEIDREGTYGFQLLVHNNEGVSARPPQRGDQADVWIRVDWTRPVVRITEAEFGTGQRQGVLDISWQASDDRLAERPVSLSYSPTRDGPWKVIASDMDNTGYWQWKADTPLPREIYLQLEVRDEAGNIGRDRLPQPISTRGNPPQGRIRNVRPIPE